MDIGEAIEKMRNGRRVKRLGWNGVGMFLEMQIPDSNSKMMSPYIYIDTTQMLDKNQFSAHTKVPWMASQTDLLAFDWEEYITE